MTAEQIRVLAFLAEHPKWMSLLKLDQIRLLETDDVVVIPSLVGIGLIEHNGTLRVIAAEYPKTA